MLNSPDEEFYVREIAKLLRKNPSGVKRELDNLEQMGVLSCRRVANLKYFCANRQSPLFEELKNLITKSLGLPGALKAVVRAAGAKAAIIYGPYAEGAQSDAVDLLIVGAEAGLMKEFKDLEKKFGFTITWIEMDAQEFKDKKAKQDPKLMRILDGKRISLVGRVA